MQTTAIQQLQSLLSSGDFTLQFNTYAVYRDGAIVDELPGVVFMLSGDMPYFSYRGSRILGSQVTVHDQHGQERQINIRGGSAMLNLTGLGINWLSQSGYMEIPGTPFMLMLRPDNWHQSADGSAISYNVGDGIIDSITIQATDDGIVFIVQSGDYQLHMS